MDYLVLYKDYTNIELLKITTVPWQHDPQAVAAANQILSTREVTEEERTALDVYSWDIDGLKDTDVVPARFTTEAKIKHFIVPLLQPFKSHNDAQWAHLFVTFAGLWYTYQTLFSLYLLVAPFFRQDLQNDIANIIFLVLNCFYFVVLIILLVKGAKWGWLLLAVIGILVLSGDLIRIYYNVFPPETTKYYALGNLIWESFVPALIFVLLWMPPVIRYFGISRNNKVAVLLIAVVITALRFISMYTYMSTIRR